MAEKIIKQVKIQNLDNSEIIAKIGVSINQVEGLEDTLSWHSFPITKEENEEMEEGE